MPEEARRLARVQVKADLDLVALGECMVEFNSQGPLREAELFNKSFGGDTLNCVVAACRLGSRAGFISRVGDDPFKDFLLKSWCQEGLDLSHVRVVPGFNAIYFISLRSDGDRDFTYYRRGSAASQISRQDLDEKYISSCRIFFTSGITQAISNTCRQAVVAGFEMARQRRCLTAYDPNYRSKLWPRETARQALEEIAPYVDIFLPSFPEETSLLLGLEDVSQVIEFFWKKGAKMVAVKKGPGGSTVGWDGKMVDIAPYPGAIVDTTGAGDAFNGAFLHGLANGLDPFRAGLLANIVAGLKISAQGAISGLPRKEEAYSIFQRIEKEGR